MSSINFPTISNYQFTYPELIKFGKTILELHESKNITNTKEFFLDVKTISSHFFITKIKNYSTSVSNNHIAALAPKSKADKLINHMKSKGDYQWLIFDLVTNEYQSSRVKKGSNVYWFINNFINELEVPVAKSFYPSIESLCNSLDPLVFFILENYETTNISILRDIATHLNPQSRDPTFYPRKFLDQIYLNIYFDLEESTRIVEGQMKAHWLYYLIDETYEETSPIEVNMKCENNFLVIRYFINDSYITKYLEKSTLNPLFYQVYEYLNIRN